MSVKSQQVTKEAPAKRVQAAPAATNRLRGFAGNHTLLKTSNARERTDHQDDQTAQPIGYNENRRRSLPLNSSHETESFTIPPIAHDVLRSPGQPLDASARSFMEPRFGHDFGHVRVHTDSRAAEAAVSINARAYSMKNHIVFGAGEYNPQTESGRRLIGHELTHVAQQRGNLIQRQKRAPATETTREDDVQLTDPDYLAKVDAELAKVAQKWVFVLFGQRDAVDEAYESAKEEAAKPSIGETLLITAGEMLLTVALGGVGSLLARAVATNLAALLVQKISKQAKRLAEEEAQVWAKKVKDAAVDVGKKALVPKVRGLVTSGKTAELIFFASQKEALNRAAEQAFDTAKDEEANIRKLPNALETAQGIFAALKEVSENAKALQSLETVQAWFTYMAQAERGLDNIDPKTAGTNLSPKSDPMIFDTPGVLYLKVNMDGDIQDAEIKGSSKYFAGLIANKQINQLKIPKIIEVKWGTLEDKNLTLRINEVGQIWIDRYSRGAGRSFWLTFTSGTERWNALGSIEYSGTDAQVEQGVTIFADIVGNRKLGKL